MQLRQNGWRPSDTGIKINRAFEVISPDELQFFGVITNDSEWLEDLGSNPKRLYGLCDMPLRSVPLEKAMEPGRYQAVFSLPSPRFQGTVGKILDLSG